MAIDTPEAFIRYAIKPDCVRIANRARMRLDFYAWNIHPWTRPEWMRAYRKVQAEYRMELAKP